MKHRLLLCLALFLSSSNTMFAQGNPGTFTPTESMSVQREQATATLITGCNCPADGKVLVAGGVINGLTFTTNTADLYDPATGRFVATGTMNVARGGHVAALLPGGRVLIAGAFDSPGPEDAEIYDPMTGTFSCVAGSDPSTGFCNPTVVNSSTVLTATSLQNGKVLITGLQTPASGGQGSVAATAAAVYDPLQATFTCLNGMSSTQLLCNSSMGSQHTSGTGTLLANGTVLIAGGSGVLGYTSSAEIYDPALGPNGTFVPTGNMLVARGNHAAVLLKTGEVLIAGGSNDSSNLNTAEVYANGTFKPVGSMAHVRADYTATLLGDGTVLVAGGCCEVSNQQLQSAEIYDPTTKTFSPTSNMNEARATHTATLLPNGQVLVAGGFFSATAELYTPSTPPPPACNPPQSIFADNSGAFGLISAVVSNEQLSQGDLTANVRVSNNLRVWLGLTGIHPVISDSNLPFPDFSPNLTAGIEGLTAKAGLLPPCQANVNPFTPCRTPGASQWVATFCGPGSIDLTFSFTVFSALVTITDVLAPPGLSTNDLVSLSAQLVTVPDLMRASECLASGGREFQCVVKAIDDLRKNQQQLKQVQEIFKSFAIDVTITELITKLLKLAPDALQIQADLIILQTETHFANKMLVSIVGK